MYATKAPKEPDVKMPPPLGPVQAPLPAVTRRQHRERQRPSVHHSTVPPIFHKRSDADGDASTTTNSSDDDESMSDQEEEDSTQQLREARAHQATELAQALGASVEKLKSLESQSDVSSAYKDIKRAFESVIELSPTLRESAAEVVKGLDETMAFSIKIRDELSEKCDEEVKRMERVLDQIRTIKEQQDKNRAAFFKTVETTRSRHAREIDEIRKRMDTEERALLNEAKGPLAPKQAEERLRKVLREFLEAF